MTDKEYTGIVEYFNSGRKFGFLLSEIYPEENPISVFFHISDVSNPDHTPQIGDKGTFTLVKDNQNRIKAYNLYLSDGEIPDEKQVG